MPVTDFIFKINYNVARLVESDLETEAITPCSVYEQISNIGRCITVFLEKLEVITENILPRGTYHICGNRYV